ncbi:MAG: hypothetical protein LBQ58_05085, partial [Synergistaceae bacterium]|nr:hypothetical protein [Synergistaceae bacterium]
MKKFFLAPLLCLMVSSCAWAEGFVRVAATGIAVNVRAEADAEGLYCVVGRELPILEKPLSPMPDTEYLDELEGIDGVIVYGNHVELRPAADGWFELMSPYDGSVLGYIPKKGLERVPDYEHAGKTGKKYFMANGDGPELSLQPGKGGDGYSLSSYGYSLAKGEVVKSVGSRSHAGERWLLLEFDTDYSGGSSGVGARYAWSPEKNFT